MLKIEDFTYVATEPSGWLWFSVNGESRQLINKTIYEQEFITVTEVGYNKKENQLGVMKQYMSGRKCDFYENNELLELINKIV